MRLTPLEPLSIAQPKPFSTPCLARQAVLIMTLMLAASVPAMWAASWTSEDGDNGQIPGRKLDIKRDGHLVARLVYGPGQIKPFLHLFGTDGEVLTNGGLDENGKTSGQFPHHRGIFIGWKITSDLGTYDLWHMTGGARMELVKLDPVMTSESDATIVATIEWRGAKKDSGDDLILTETRRLNIGQDRKGQTRVDGKFTLRPARDLKLVGDLQHSGVHFRAANEVAVRKSETSYLYEPDGVVKGDNLKWCRLVFPAGSRWYSAQQINPASNPVEELSMRDYGRFGYFFKRELKKDVPLELNYRFLVEAIEAPAKAPDHVACEANYQAFKPGS